MSVAPSRPRIAVIGAGWWASNSHIPALAQYPGAELVAVCDLQYDRARALATQWHIPHVVETVPKLVKDIKPDGVIIATPHNTHHALSRTALEAGIHVLVEKPLAVSSAQAWDLVELAERRQLHLSVGYTYQYPSSALEIRRAVQGGAIGDLLHISAEFTSDVYTLFRDAADDSINADDPLSPHPSAYSAANGGGHGNTQLTHVMGMVCWITGLKVNKVFALMSNGDLDVDVNDALTMEFDNGALGVCSGHSYANGPGVRHRAVYSGTTGVIYHDLLAARATMYSHDGTQRIFDIKATEPAYPDSGVARAFADLIAGRGPNLAPGRDAAAAAACLAAAYASARSGRAEATANSVQ